MPALFFVGKERKMCIRDSCPHATIRPFALTADEAAKAPAALKSKKMTGKDCGDYVFTMTVSPPVSYTHLILQSSLTGTPLLFSTFLPHCTYFAWT